MRRRGKGQHFCLTFPQPKTCSFLTQKKKKWKGLLKKDFPAEVDGSHTRFMLSLPFYRSKIFFLLMLYPDSLRFHTQSPCTWPTKSFLKAFPPAIRQFLRLKWKSCKQTCTWLNLSYTDDLSGPYAAFEEEEKPVTR